MIFKINDKVIRHNSTTKHIYVVQDIYVEGDNVLYLIRRNTSPSKPWGYYAKESELRLIDDLVDDWHNSDSKQELVEYLGVEPKDFENNYLRSNVKLYNFLKGHTNCYD